MRISFFKNQATQYNVLHYFRENLSDALEGWNVSTSLIDFTSLDRSSFFRAIYSQPPDFTFAFNGLKAFPNGSFLCDELEIPHIAWIVDSAHYFLDLIKSPLNIIITPDKTSADIMKQWGAKQAFFLPHAFDSRLATSTDTERPLPLVFLGSLMDPIQIETIWEQKIPSNIVKSLKEGAEKTLNIPTQTYQQSFDEILQKHSSFFNALNSLQLADLVTALDQYVRAKDRINILKSLEGIPIHIYGNTLSNRNWGDFLDLKNGDYKISPGIPFPEAIEVMKKAKIVLNSSPMFKTGAHERIFYGLGLGAAVLTNETPWNQENFTKEELLTYSSCESTQIYDQVNELLAHPEKLKKMAALGQEKVLKKHTWDVRAKQLLERLYDF